MKRHLSIYRSALMILAGAAYLSCIATGDWQSPPAPPPPAPDGGVAPPDDDERCRRALWSSFPDFTQELCSALPRDVDRELNERYRERGEPKKINRLFDILAWQSFIAMAWPVADDGRTRLGLAAAGAPWWDTWKNGQDVFRPDGAKPDGWDPAAQRDKRNGRGAASTTEAHGAQLEDRQSDSLVLWDQNGNKVYYEVLFNEHLFDFLVRNELYNLDGQIAHRAQHDDIPEAPWGNAVNVDQMPSIALKLAWKVVDEDKGDIKERFILREAYIRTDAGPSKRTLGLVGANFMMKTLATRKHWTWVAFEHIDNVDVNDLETHGGKPLKPLFNDPSCPLCPVNEPPDARVWPVTVDPWVPRTQVHRQQPIREDTAALNSKVQALLKASGSALQFYELIGTQWATDPLSAPSPSGALPDAIVNESGGKPSRAYLVNAVIETYLQRGNAVAADVNDALRFAPTRLFHTGSCMGCHSGAPIAEGASRDGIVWSSRGSGDFLWSLSKRARPRAAAGGGDGPDEMTSTASAHTQPERKE
ncbi:hypothetical protein [Sorangium sp. So ce385]|uniref:hypothetical protein n=1 Tax=Sorangium sp. So ce385 TaxID=3133308 RepID=UPI003F5BF7E6